MIISFSGPSGIGKGFIKERILQIHPYIKELAWFTTRPLRPKEGDGNRVHLPLSEFNKLVEAGDLVLVQDLFSYRYGVKAESLFPDEQIRLTEIHPDNIKQALKINPSILSIGFITRDFALLRERLLFFRGTENEAEIEQRVALAEIEIETILRHKALFASVIEVDKSSESLILDQVLAILSPYLKEKGE